MNQNSCNTNKPPSSDSPFAKQSKDRPGKKKKSRKGFRQEMLEPNKTITVPPESCACGCCEFDNL
ncbi:MAG: hypothetical protein MUO63_09980 [Desulfobulbaceae bacterium]|nr:hypothetical protein [Desulfobulbaceae bacterium]